MESILVELGHTGRKRAVRDHKKVVNYIPKSHTAKHWSADKSNYTYHPSTYPWSTNQVSFLLDSTVLLRLSRAYSQM